MWNGMALLSIDKGAPIGLKVVPKGWEIAELRQFRARMHRWNRSLKTNADMMESQD